MSGPLRNEARDISYDASHRLGMYRQSPQDGAVRFQYSGSFPWTRAAFSSPITICNVWSGSTSDPFRVGLELGDSPSDRRFYCRGVDRCLAAAVGADTHRVPTPRLASSTSVEAMCAM